ncbi:MAG: glucan biosynthesis protein G [Pseudomonadota bacterium]
MKLTRRHALALAAAAGLAPSAGATDAEPGVQVGPSVGFAPADVVAKARDLANRPYVPPVTVPKAWRDLTYDQYRKIWFDTRNALWRNAGCPVQVEFFAPGLYFPAPIRVHAVEAGEAAPVLFDLAVFDTTDKLPDLPVDETLGYSGLRLHGELESAGVFQEYAVFQGASYFRAIGMGQIYGLSARGLAVNTAGPAGEEFPEFREFWVEKPEVGQPDVVVHALLDGPSVTGAFRFRIQHGKSTVMDVEATIIPRQTLEHVGIAAGTSMFFYDQTNRAGYEDFRPAVHDSDGLLIVNGRGEQLWRPLANPMKLQVSSFVDDGPQGFGLMQRARAFSEFADLSAKYHLRPGLWVEPGENWGAGAVTLVEIPTDKEIYDNIVAYWRPRAPLSAGDAHRFSYRLHWCEAAPIRENRAQVINTHMGRSFSGARIAAIDFADHPAIPEDLSTVTIHTSANRGSVTDGILQRNPETGGVRLDFGFEPREDRAQELRAQLVVDGRTISEVWLYRWTPS